MTGHGNSTGSGAGEPEEWPKKNQQGNVRGGLARFQMSSVFGQV